MDHGGLLLTHADRAGGGRHWESPANPNNKAGMVYRGLTTAIAPHCAAWRSDTSQPAVNTEGL